MRLLVGVALGVALIAALLLVLASEVAVQPASAHGEPVPDESVERIVLGASRASASVEEADDDSLRVRVTSARTGRPIEDAGVWTNRGVARFVEVSAVVGRTDSLGELVVPTVEPTFDRLGVFATGYAPRVVPVDRQAEIHVELSEGLQLTLEATDLVGRPIAGIPLVASRTLVEGAMDPWADDDRIQLPFGDDRSSAFSASTDSAGVARFVDLPPGRYDVRPCASSGFLAVVSREAHGPYSAGSHHGRMMATRLVGCAVTFAREPVVRCEVIRSMASVDPADEAMSVEAISAILREELPHGTHLHLWPASSKQLDQEGGVATLAWLGETNGWVTRSVAVSTWDRLPQRVLSIESAPVHPSRCGTLSIDVRSAGGQSLAWAKKSARRIDSDRVIDIVPTEFTGTDVVLESGEYDVFLSDVPGSMRAPLERIRIEPGTRLEHVVTLGFELDQVVLRFLDKQGHEHRAADVRLYSPPDAAKSLRNSPFMESGTLVLIPVGSQFRARVRAWPYQPVEALITGISHTDQRELVIVVEP